MDPVASAVLESWRLDWGALAILLASAVVYTRGWNRLRREMPHRYNAPRLTSFYLGLGSLFLALASPLDSFAGLLLTAHMLQHLLLLMVAPPLLLLGQPVLPLLRGLPMWASKDVLGPFLGWRELKQVGSFAVHPTMTWIAMTASVIGWHLPAAYDLALREPFWHGVEHAVFFWCAVLFWWPVIEPWPAKGAAPRWITLPYLLLADLVNTGLAATLSFSHGVIYRAYAAAPSLWGISALNDQAAAGMIMWVPGSIAFLIPFAIIGARLLEPHSPRQPTPVVRNIRPASRTRQWDLLHVPVLGGLLRRPYFRPSVQYLMLLLAAIVAIDGFVGPQSAPLNLAGILPWTYWRGFAVIALLVAGNLFCMACPFTVPRDLLRHLFPPAFRWPRPLQTKWMAAGLFGIYLWAYEAFSPWDSPRATAWIIVSYFAAVLVVDSLFKGAPFCKYFCPIGQFHFVHSLVSPLGVNVKEPSLCATCRTHDCIRGNASRRGCEMGLFQPAKVGNFDCTFCLDCVHACPQQNVGIVQVVPLAVLLTQRRGSGTGRLVRRLDVAALVALIVFGAYANAVGMTEMPRAVKVLYWSTLSLVPALLLALAFRWKDHVCAFTLGLIPLGFGMWLSHFCYHLVTGWNSVVPVLGRFFSMPAFAGAESPPASWIRPLQFGILDAALLCAFYALWRVARGFSEDPRNRLAMFSPWALLATLLYTSGVWLIFQPMQMRGMVM